MAITMWKWEAPADPSEDRSKTVPKDPDKVDRTCFPDLRVPGMMCRCQAMSKTNSYKQTNCRYYVGSHWLAGRDGEKSCMYTKVTDHCDKVTLKDGTEVN